MTTLNRDAAAALAELEEKAAGAKPVHAVTDVTGFSLLGHAREMALGDPVHGTESVSFEIDHRAFAYLPGAVEAARDGHLSGGLKNNRAFIGDCAIFDAQVPPEYQDLLFDPQTSGGLLISISADFADAANSALHRRGVSARCVGGVLAKRNPLLFIR
jgi:selenide,water dikinase